MTRDSTYSTNALDVSQLVHRTIETGLQKQVLLPDLFNDYLKYNVKEAII